MKFVELTKRDLEIVNLAKRLVKDRHSKITSVASILRTRSNKIFSGVHVEAKLSSLSVCAERIAIGNMITLGGKIIDTIVAACYQKGKYSILHPCGSCRQFMLQFGNPYIIVKVKNSLKKVKLSELLPLPYK